MATVGELANLLLEFDIDATLRMVDTNTIKELKIEPGFMIDQTQLCIVRKEDG